MSSIIEKLRVESKKTDNPAEEFLHIEKSVTIQGKSVNAKFVSLKAAEYTVAWILDNQSNNCMKCDSAFGLFNRRHHCRVCGLLFCNACSSKLIVVPNFAEQGGSRACEGCVALSSTTAAQASETPLADDTSSKESPSSVEFTTVSTVDATPVKETTDEKPVVVEETAQPEAVTPEIAPIAESQAPQTQATAEPVVEQTLVVEATKPSEEAQAAVAEVVDEVVTDVVAETAPVASEENKEVEVKEEVKQVEESPVITEAAPEIVEVSPEVTEVQTEAVVAPTAEPEAVEDANEERPSEAVDGEAEVDDEPAAAGKGGKKKNNKKKKGGKK